MSLHPYRHLEALGRKCRHPPMMGGNTETIRMPCILVSRLLSIVTAAAHMRPDNIQPCLDAIAEELEAANDYAGWWYNNAHIDDICRLCDETNSLRARAEKAEAELAALQHDLKALLREAADVVAVGKSRISPEHRDIRCTLCGACVTQHAASCLISRLRAGLIREGRYLHHYGNNDCTAMADEAVTRNELET